MTENRRGRPRGQVDAVAGGHPLRQHLLPDQGGVQGPGQVHREHTGGGDAAG